MPNSLALFQVIVEIFLNRDVFKDDYPDTKRNILQKQKEQIINDHVLYFKIYCSSYKQFISTLFTFICGLRGF